ncbi:hypothetical protein IKL45_02790 [Candidatus Saccharibacteria bacterium]|nr:hypothetical protein [Candidatus Saccharibacteria bacterium]MBR6122082.1 hypothetical protein [Candidatus Saccharibacteria bacterium]
MDASFIALFGSILVVGILVFVAIILTGKRKYTFNKLEYQTDFLAIENSLTKENPQSYNMSVVEGDKLLDKALLEMGLSGRTMGERLKKCGKEKFSQTNAVWNAHKLRNQIAHEPGFKLEYHQAKHALAIYKQALRDLGAI